MSKDDALYALGNILLPTDGSKYSIKAAKYTAEIAKKHGSKVTLLHVLELNLPTADHPIEFDDLESVWIAIEDENEIKNCQDFFSNIKEKANRIKKSMMDTQELMRQYKEVATDRTKKFTTDFCNNIVAEAEGIEALEGIDCENATPEDVINKFIKLINIPI